MSSISLGSDNHSGVHPRILSAIQKVNSGHAASYEMDPLSAETQKLFQEIFGKNSKSFFVFNGTAANVLSLQSALKSYEAALVSDVSHLHVDECGAPEKFVGAKLIALPSKNGKIFPESAVQMLSRQGDQHASQVKLVSLTQPTELGTCYTLEELRVWKDYCREKSLMLHIDGARLANAAHFLNTSLAELTTDIGADVVSLGGTKNGLLGVEAVVLLNPKLHEGFKYWRKQALQLPSKSRFLAAQFQTYLGEGLYKEISRHVHEQALYLQEHLREFSEIEVVYPVESNALFVRIPKDYMKPLREFMFFYIWDEPGRIARWMISWDWQREWTDRLVQKIQEVRK